MRLRTRHCAGDNLRSSIFNLQSSIFDLQSTVRAGVTLTEALVAIFVCSLGLMALMTLFPLGAVNMAQAIKDDRCAHSAANAAAILRSVWRASLMSGGADSGNPYADDPSLQELEDLLLTGNGVPVYIDPIGVRSYFGAAQTSLGGAIPRWTFRGTSFPQAVRWCTLLDDIVFEPNGVAQPLTGEIMREGRYSWAWMVRGIRTQNPPPVLTPPLPPVWWRALEFTVVVYKNRPLTQNASLLPTGESVPIPVGFNVNPTDPTHPNNFMLNVSGAAPVKKGQWILDLGTGYFYRVTRVDSTGGQTRLTVHAPLTRGRGAPGNGNIMVMTDVAEVFERLTLE